MKGGIVLGSLALLLAVSVISCKHNENTTKLLQKGDAIK